MISKDILRDRFIRYTAFDTMSDSTTGLRPSTKGQEVLLLALKEELEALGLETYYGEEKVLMGVLEATAPGTPVAFMAHVDTANAVPGNGVKARIHRAYDGSPIELEGITLSDEELKDYIGDEIITSDGTTLLGSDDKAGIAIIITALEKIIEDGRKHPRIEVYFTPDEEIGCGIDVFPFERMKASVCYTIDGESEGEIEDECFNAASVTVTIDGDAAHLGSGRGRIHNAGVAAARIATLLPSSESPESTDGRYGYYAVEEIHGTMEHARLEIFLRDFDYDNLLRRIDGVKSAAESVGKLYSVRVSINQRIQYRNMKEANDSNPESMERIWKCAEKLGIKLTKKAIRGGTDGSRLAEKGIASPNIFTGGHHLHSRTEWIAVGAMAKSASLVYLLMEGDE